MDPSLFLTGFVILPSQELSRLGVGVDSEQCIGHSKSQTPEMLRLQMFFNEINSVFAAGAKCPPTGDQQLPLTSMGIEF